MSLLRTLSQLNERIRELERQVEALQAKIAIIEGQRILRTPQGITWEKLNTQARSDLYKSNVKNARKVRVPPHDHTSPDQGGPCFAELGAKLVSLPPPQPK